MAATTTIAGNLTADPELRFTNDGTAVARFTVAVTERRRQGDQWTDGDTSYFRCSIWHKLAEHAAESLRKGDPGHRHRPAQAARMGDRGRRGAQHDRSRSR